MDITKIVEGLLDKSKDIKREQKKLNWSLFIIGLWGCLSMVGFIYYLFVHSKCH